jgi:hypothetical protein
MSSFINLVGQNNILGLQTTAFDNAVHSDCEIHVGNKRFKVGFIDCIKSSYTFRLTVNVFCLL